MAAHPIVLHTPLNFIYGLAWIACLGETVGRRAVACFGHGEALEWCFTASQTQCPLDSDCLSAPALSVSLIVTLFPHSFPFHRSKQPRSSSITKDPLLVPPFRSLRFGPSPLPFILTLPLHPLFDLKSFTYHSVSQLPYVFDSGSISTISSSLSSRCSSLSAHESRPEFRVPSSPLEQYR